MRSVSSSVVVIAPDIILVVAILLIAGVAVVPGWLVMIFKAWVVL